jgi:general L-amino acid transport system substrate-binding protein
VPDRCSVCVQSDTTAAHHVADYFRLNKMTYAPVTYEKIEDMRAAFFGGRCEVLAADRSTVYAARASYAANPNDYLVLPESASREPLGLIVRSSDQAFREIVRWSLYVMIEGEEEGINSRNVDDMLKSDAPNIKRMLGVTPGLGKSLGLDEAWAYNIIKQIGNYGESYERNVGAGSSLRIPRSLNALASEGGLQYAPPLR